MAVNDRAATYRQVHGQLPAAISLFEQVLHNRGACSATTTRDTASALRSD